MDSVPVIDVAALRSNSPAALRNLAAEIGRAARGIGFFTIRNHGVPRALTARLFAAAAEFFALPQVSKDSLATAEAGYVGYQRLAVESRDPHLAGDYKESFLAMRELPDDDPDLVAHKPFVERNHWPILPGFRETLTAYFAAVHDVAMAMHRALAIDVHTDPDAFLKNFDRPLSGLSILHYPPHPGPFDGTRYGAAPHTDWGGFTLLAQDQTGGLEVQRRDGAWVDVNPVPDTLVCNIGDALMRWTNDVYVSNSHRVVNRSERERYSAAFFCNPNGDTKIIPMPSCTSGAQPPKYPPISYAELLQSRLDALLPTPG